LFFLSQASLYLAISPKSNSTKSIFNALEKVKSTNVSLVPSHLKNNASSYKNPHDYPGNWVKQDYLPHHLKELKFWNPLDCGLEDNQYLQFLKRKKD